MSDERERERLAACEAELHQAKAEWHEAVNDANNYKALLREAQADNADLLGKLSRQNDAYLAQSIEVAKLRDEKAREADQLMGDMAGVRKDAAAVERARIREALVDKRYFDRCMGMYAVLWTHIERICGPAPVIGTTTNTAHEVDADWSGDPLKDALAALEATRATARKLRDALAEVVHGLERDYPIQVALLASPEVQELGGEG